jgi:hypothetical protein
MPDDTKSLAQRAAEYLMRRRPPTDTSDPERLAIGRWAVRDLPDRVIAVYVEAESECDRLRSENASLRAALHRLGQIEGHKARGEP